MSENDQLSRYEASVGKELPGSTFHARMMKVICWLVVLNYPVFWGSVYFYLNTAPLEVPDILGIVAHEAGRGGGQTASAAVMCEWPVPLMNMLFFIFFFWLAPFLYFFNKHKDQCEPFNCKSWHALLLAFCSVWLLCWSYYIPLGTLTLGTTVPTCSAMWFMIIAPAGIAIQLTFAMAIIRSLFTAYSNWQSH